MNRDHYNLTAKGPQCKTCGELVRRGVWWHWKECSKGSRPRREPSFERWVKQGHVTAEFLNWEGAKEHFRLGNPLSLAKICHQLHIGQAASDDGYAYVRIDGCKMVLPEKNRVEFRIRK